ncbi:MAG: hypothetical protein PHV34_06740 [Verrucomicrobiae bacterium]|nr:hypothetical protein [Verrucomicrobiae bacterium]
MHTSVGYRKELPYIAGMSQALQDNPKPTGSALKLKRVGEHLFRSQTSGRYYMLVKRVGKIFHTSLKTCDKEVAKIRLEEYLAEVPGLKPGSGKMTFEELVEEFKTVVIPAMEVKESSKDFRKFCVASIMENWPEKTKRVRMIGKDDCLKWYAARSEKDGPSYLNNMASTLKMIFDRAVEKGYITKSPAKDLKRMKPQKSEPSA